jgi:hypothetical protein
MPGEISFSLQTGAVSVPAQTLQVRNGGTGSFTWTGSTTDPRAPQQAAAGSSNRVASTWYSLDGFSIDIGMNDGLSHRVALYALDWDSPARTETVEVIDIMTGTVLDTRSLTSFQGGVYLVWNLSGKVRLKVTNTGPSNAVIAEIRKMPARFP